MTNVNYSRWLHEEYWLLSGPTWDAICLILGFQTQHLKCLGEPPTFGFIADEERIRGVIDLIEEDRASDRWGVREEVLGTSLGTMRLVHGGDFVRWAIQHGYDVPLEVRSYSGKYPAEEKETSAATRARVAQRAKRIAVLEAFINDIRLRAKARGLRWATDGDRLTIPDSKQSFHKVFRGCFPDIAEVSVATLADDVAELGVRFTGGRKSKKGSVLADLFPRAGR